MRWICLVWLLATIVWPLSAQEAAWRLPGGSMERFQFTNGPTVVMQSRPDLPAVGVALSIPLGSGHSPSAGVLGYLLRRHGLLGYEQMGARTGYRVLADRTVFWEVVPRSQLAWELENVLGRFSGFQFDEPSIDRAYRAVAREWRLAGGDERLHQLLLHPGFAPLSGPPSGPELEQIGLQYVNAQGSVLCLTGGFQPAEVRGLLESLRVPASQGGPLAASAPAGPASAAGAGHIEWLWKLPASGEETAHLAVMSEVLRDRGLMPQLDWQAGTFSVRRPTSPTENMGQAEAALRASLDGALQTLPAMGWRGLQMQAQRRYLQGFDDLGERAVQLACDESLTHLARANYFLEGLAKTTPLTSTLFCRGFLREPAALKGYPALGAEPEIPAERTILTRSRPVTLKLPDTRAFPAGSPGFQRVELDGGMTLLVQPVRDLGTVTVRGYLSGGTLEDPVALAGRTHLLAKSLQERGPGPSLELRYEPQLGYVSIEGWTPHDALEEWFAALIDSLTAGPLQASQVEAARARLVADLRASLGNVEGQAYERWLQLLYPEEHPLGRSSLQLVNGVQNCPAGEVNALLGKLSRPDRLTLVLSGDVTVEAATRRLVPLLRKWVPAPDGGPVGVLPAPRRHDSPPALKVPARGNSALVLLGKVGPSRRDADFYAFTLLNQVLADDSTSRLALRLRDKERIATAVQGRILAGNGPMPWLISVRCAPEHADRCVAVVREELVRIAREGPTPDEITRAAHHLEGQLMVSQASSWGRASLLRNMEMFRLADNYTAGFAGLYRGLTPRDLQEVAKRRLALEDLATVVVGP